MEICELKREDEKAWNEYVLKNPGSTFYHQIGWKNVVEKSYGHRPYYLLAKEEGEIKGILPLFFMKSQLFGRKLISVPFAPYGGICADDDIIKNKLLEKAISIVYERDLDLLEIRDTMNYYNSKLEIDESYVTYIINLEINPQKVWDRIKRDRQRNVEKAKKYNLKLGWNAKIEDFYKIHAETMRDLGTPTHDIKFFKKCLSEFQNDAKVIIVRHDDVIIGCQLLFLFKDIIIAAWGSSLNKNKIYNPDQITVWEVIKYGCTNGYKYFDFGRCLCDTGAYRYKERWGGYSKQLYYQYFLNNANTIPDTSQTNPRRQKFANFWKKIPIQITNILGSKIRKNIP